MSLLRRIDCRISQLSASQKAPKDPRDPSDREGKFTLRGSPPRFSWVPYLSSLAKRSPGGFREKAVLALVPLPTGGQTRPPAISHYPRGQLEGLASLRD